MQEERRCARITAGGLNRAERPFSALSAMRRSLDARCATCPAWDDPERYEGA